MVLAVREYLRRAGGIFLIAPEYMAAATNVGGYCGLLHCYPGGLPWLSKADRRAFEHGVTDCYTLFRDSYYLAGIKRIKKSRSDHGAAGTDKD